MPSTNKHLWRGHWGLGPAKGTRVITVKHSSGVNRHKSSFVNLFLIMTSTEKNLLGREENLANQITWVFNRKIKGDWWLLRVFRVMTAMTHSSVYKGCKRNRPQKIDNAGVIIKPQKESMYWTLHHTEVCWYSICRLAFDGVLCLPPCTASS